MAMKITPLIKFSAVFSDELEQIKIRRTIAKIGSSPDEKRDVNKDLVGLALSGGGIRSATFCLGLLQGLHSRGLLRMFDYMSTVSGGGYVGGWWSAWLSRKATGNQAQIFVDEEKDEIERSDMRLDERNERHSLGQRPVGENRPEGAECAGIDPLHHLRLFANYLTPRRGILSSDTWRAVTFITRNLVMTWLVLLPLLVALVLAGQLYFAMHPDPVANFIEYPDDKAALTEKVRTEQPQADSDAVAQRVTELTNIQREGHRTALQRRLRFALQPLIALAGWICLMATMWLLFTLHTREKSEAAVVAVCLLAVAAVVLCLLFSSEPLLLSLRQWFLQAPGWRVSWGVVAAILVIYSLWPPQASDLPDGDDERKKQWMKELIRTRITLLHAKLLVSFVVIAVVLGIAGFGHEIIKAEYGSVLAPLTQSGGLLAIAAAVFGLIFTGYKATPKGGGDKKEAADPSKVSRFVFAATPPLVVLVLAFTAAWFGHGVLAFISKQPGAPPDMVRYLTYATFFGIAVCLILAMLEMDWQEGRPPFWLYLSLAAPTVPALVVLIRLFRLSEGMPVSLRNVLNAFALTVFGLGVLYICIKILAKRFKGVKPKERISLFTTASNLSTTERVKGLVGNVLTLGIYAYWFGYEIRGQSPGGVTSAGPSPGWFFPISLLIAATFAGGYIAYRLSVVSTIREATGLRRSFSLAFFRRWAHQHRRDALWLLTSACVVLAIAASCGAHAVIAEHEERMVQHSPLEVFNIVEFVLVNLLAMEPVKALMLALPVTALLAALGIFFCKKTWELMSEGEPAGGLDRKVIERSQSIRSVWTDAFQPRSRILFALLAVGCIWISVNVVQMTFEILNHTALETRPVQTPLTSLTLAGVVLCLAFTRFEITWGRGENRHSLWLLACAYIALIVLLMISFMPHLADNTQILYGYVVFALIATALTWVIGLGWMADPNAFSMHAFYRARLVRAYMGASNENRREDGKEITEAAAGDDVLMADLKNCDRGAPYHLINTTLNLVAGRDLAFSQRSAAAFTLSQRYCGSLRTGYRPTTEYMDGRLTLGSAVAISGAAASPNMGAKTPTSALAMLLTLLNVRLGYWAPTPDRKDWTSPQARLWPFYLMREFASQTNDVSSYCYLTDGGHFENTGLYSLVQRGCRFIVVADCGADPKTSFGDLGDAIRRCRIDFGAEINLDIEHFVKYEREQVERPVQQHWVAGTITYSADHLRRLRGIPKRVPLDEKDCRGFVVLIKPSLTAKDGADVRQYVIENEDFPQTATSNQFFDEAQFECYRRLGEICGDSAFHSAPAPGSLKTSKDIEDLFAAVYNSQMTRKPKKVLKGHS